MVKKIAICFAAYIYIGACFLAASEPELSYSLNKEIIFESTITEGNPYYEPQKYLVRFIYNQKTDQLFFTMYEPIFPPYDNKNVMTKPITVKIYEYVSKDDLCAPQRKVKKINNLGNKVLITKSQLSKKQVNPMDLFDKYTCINAGKTLLGAYEVTEIWKIYKSQDLDYLTKNTKSTNNIIK